MVAPFPLDTGTSVGMLPRLPFAGGGTMPLSGMRWMRSHSLSPVPRDWRISCVPSNAQ